MGQTPKDKKASVVIHGLVDKVIAGIMHRLNLKIPPYVRVDLVQISLTHFPGLSGKKYVKWTLRVGSVHGPRAPLPFIKSVEADQSLKQLSYISNFMHKREMLRTSPFRLVLKFNFGDGCGCECASIEFPVNFELFIPNASTAKFCISG